MQPLTFEAFNLLSFLLLNARAHQSEHRCDENNQSGWLLGKFTWKRQGSIYTRLSFFFICQERFKVNGRSNWKGSLQIENIPPQTWKWWHFYPLCGINSTLPPLTQMALCNFVSIQPQNRRKKLIIKKKNMKSGIWRRRCERRHHG